MNMTNKLLRSMCRALILMAALPCLLSAQWIPLGPYGGGTQVLTNVPSQPGTLIAGTRNAQLYRSKDNAVSWQPVPFPRALRATLNTLIVDPCSPSTMYVGVTDSAHFPGLYKTVNGGVSWIAVPELDGESVTSLAAAPSACGTIAAGTLSGVILTGDDGATWNRVSPADHPDLHPVVSLAFDSSSPDIIYAGTPHLPWKTTNRGKTWDSIHFGIQNDSDIFSITPYGSRVLIGACSGVYRSIDGGTNWLKVLGIPGDSRRTYVVKPDPANSRVIYAGTSMGLWKSMDGGTTWIQKSNLPVRSVAIAPEDSRRLFLATDGGVLKSIDGGETLKPANNGFANRKLEAFEDAGGLLLTSAAFDVGTGRSIFTSADFGRTWLSPNATTGPSEAISMFAKSDRNIFAAGSQRIFRSETRGKTWIALKHPFKGITAIESVPFSHRIFATTNNELYVSKDEGTTWLNIELPSAIVGIRLLRFAPDGRTWGIGTREGVFLSNDAGATWNELKTPPQNGNVYDFALQTKNAIAIGTLRGLATSTDGGLHWRAPSQGLNAGTVETVLWHPQQKNLMFAVQNGQAYRSADSGATWNEIRTDEFVGDSILNLHWSADHSRLYAVTSARGIFAQGLSLASSASTGGSDF
jgi:photosystem II stability/assembly factor-like uncharacterized protein